MVTDPLPLAAAGLLVGVIVGLTGVGGGSLMTPLLVLVFGQAPSVAVGTDLVFAAATKVAATASFGYSRRVDWQVVRRLALGSVPATLGIAIWFWASRRAPARVDAVIAQALGVLLALTAAGLLLQGALQRLGLRLASRTLNTLDRWKPALTVVVGVLLGTAVALTSVGAGAIGTVALLYLYPLRLTPDRLVATDIAHALPVTLVAGFGHALIGHVNVSVLGWLLAGSLPGVFVASRATLRLPPIVTRAGIAVVLVLVSVQLIRLR